MREQYFRRDGDAWSPVPALQARISSWSVVNLLSPEEVAPLAGSAVVFCRNAFIYFAAAAVADVVGRLAAAMPAPGYLCLAASESLLRVTDRFQLEEIGGAFVYVKR
jgi:chemotaxis protein methyltransferase CheR